MPFSLSNTNWMLLGGLSMQYSNATNPSTNSEAIVEHQYEYFMTVERTLRPMILKDIADKIDMDISTVSQVANSKYIDTPYGTKLLRTFFSSH